jgi:hypothetical protein
MLKTVFFFMAMDGTQPTRRRIATGATDRAKDARRYLLERRYPYLSGGARAGLGTVPLRAGRLIQAPWPRLATAPVEPEPLPDAA